MIGKGNLHAHGGKLAIYMVDRGRGEVIDKRGFLSDDLHEGFCTIQAIAESQTRCEKPFFHTYVRLPPGENLTAAQWLGVVDRFEHKLGFDDQPRAVVVHCDPAGDRHIHVAWSRIDTEQMCAIDPGLYKSKMVELCRDLEVEYGLKLLTSDRRPQQKTRAARRDEFDEARRLGVDVEECREFIRKCYDRSDNGSSFVAALNERGLCLGRGDQRDFVVIDCKGGQHALGRRICGVTAGEIRRRLGNAFKDSLPTVIEIKSQVADLKRRHVDEEGLTKMDEPSDEKLASQSRREADELKELGIQEKRLQEFKRQREADAEEARRREAERWRSEERRASEGDIASAKDRYADALGKNYDVSDPYGSLARAAMAEYGAFNRQQAQLRKEIAQTKDPEKREALELRRRIEGCEYMAVTSQRLAGISATVAGREDSPIAVRDREHAKLWQDEANKLREQRASQQAERDKQHRGEVADQLGDLRRSVEKGDRHQERTDSKAEISDAKAAKLAKLAQLGASYEQREAVRQRTGSRGRE